MLKTLNFKNIISILILITFSLTINSCGIYRKTDSRTIPTNADERIAKNVKEGKGFKIGNVGNRSSGDFQFASSNPLWRASLDILDFVPITNASYSGGILITDWYDDGEKEEAIKITIRFLSNEIRADAINVTIYQKNCRAYKECQANNLDGKIKEELQLAILKKASQLKKATLKKKK